MSTTGALGVFLRSRRDALSPERAGIAPFPGMRRVPGLRREEVAFLAGISADHYSRIEQGRQAVVGDDIVVALTRALRLDAAERTHLRDLAAPSRRRRDDGIASDAPDPGLLRVMAVLHVPALMLGRRGTVLARNALLCDVLGAPMPTGSSFPRWLFLDPGARARITNWTDFAAAAVESLRYESGRHPDDRELAALVAELCDADPDVARWWSGHGVTTSTSVTKHITHPVHGPLEFGIEAVSRPQDPDRTLVVYTTAPDSPTARALAAFPSRPAGAGR